MDDRAAGLICGRHIVGKVLRRSGVTAALKMADLAVTGTENHTSGCQTWGVSLNLADLVDKSNFPIIPGSSKIVPGSVTIIPD